MTAMLAMVAREAARRFGDRAAFVAAGGWPLSYSELDRAADEIAADLDHHGIGPGDLVALVLPSTPDYVAIYIAISRLGAVATGINPRLSPTERSTVIAHAEPALTVVTDELASGLPAGLATVELTVGIDPAHLATGLRRTSGREDRPWPAPEPDATAAVVWTSGTTGQPKGAVFANRQLEAIAQADTGGTWDGGGHMLAATQFAHVGFMTKLPWYLMSGGTTHLLDRWRAADALALISRHAMASVGGVAPQVALMLGCPDFDDYDFSAVRAIIMGGAASPPALVEEARRRFDAPYSIRYSSTESGGIGTATAFDAKDDEALASIGRPRPGVEVRIIDDDGAPIDDGEVGQLTLRSPTQMSSYWHSPEATAETLVDGWLHTGDLARAEENGLVRLAGRLTEMYIRGGYNVYPQEVEAVLGSHPAVRDVAVIPRPDRVMGEIGVAVIVPRDRTDNLTLATLQEFSRDRLAPYKLPEALRLVDALPFTAMQKLDRRTLAADDATVGRARADDT
jgi:acyl-CoA synthetase (AMP-forming)/AMP-acid ligase II